MQAAKDTLAEREIKEAETPALTYTDDVDNTAAITKKPVSKPKAAPKNQNKAVKANTPVKAAAPVAPKAVVAAPVASASPKASTPVAASSEEPTVNSIVPVQEEKVQAPVNQSQKTAVEVPEMQNDTPQNAAQVPTQTPVEIPAQLEQPAPVPAHAPSQKVEEENADEEEVEGNVLDMEEDNPYAF